jgi:hypothetical protein
VAGVRGKGEVRREGWGGKARRLGRWMGKVREGSVSPYDGKPLGWDNKMSVSAGLLLLPRGKQIPGGYNRRGANLETTPGMGVAWPWAVEERW